MKKCILTRILGKQMLSIMDEMNKLYDLPVVGFTPWEFAEQNMGLTQAQRMERGLEYSFPGFFRENIRDVEKLSWRELDSRQQSLEDQLGINDTCMLMSYDRGFMLASDYRESRNLQVVSLLFADKLLSELDPVFFWAGRASFLYNIISDALMQRGTPTLTLATACHHQDRLIALDSAGRQLGMPEAFEDFKNGLGDKYDARDVESIDKWTTDFVNRPARPDYADYNARSTTKSMKEALQFLWKNYTTKVKEYQENEVDRRTGTLTSPHASVMNWPSRFIRMQAVARTNILVKKPDMERKFIYLPLHFTPEVTDMYYGRDYSHHEGFVVNLAKRLPSNCCLYVKEHTSMVGYRELDFYKKLQALPNVEVIHPSVSTFDLIQNSEAVLTVTGSAGWEGYLLGKPVIVLGHVFYNFLPGVLRMSLWDSQFHVKVADYIRNFAPNSEEQRAAARAWYVSSVHVTDDYLWDDLDDTDIKAAEYAMTLKRFQEQWGGWLTENDAKAYDIRDGETCE